MLEGEIISSQQGESSKQQLHGKRLQESYSQCGIYEGNLSGERDVTLEWSGH